MNPADNAAKFPELAKLIEDCDLAAFRTKCRETGRLAVRALRSPGHVRTLLHAAASYGPGRVEFASFLFSFAAIPIDEPDTYGYTPLLTACESGAIDTALELLERGAQTDRLTVEGLGCVYLLASAKGPKGTDAWNACLAELTSKGAPVNGANGRGETALHKVIYARCIPAAIQLVACGANVAQKTTAGFTCLDYAVQTANEPMVRLLATAPNSGLGPDDLDTDTIRKCKNEAILEILDSTATSLLAAPAGATAIDPGASLSSAGGSSALEEDVIDVSEALGENSATPGLISFLALDPGQFVLNTDDFPHRQANLNLQLLRYQFAIELSSHKQESSPGSLTEQDSLLELCRRQLRTYSQLTQLGQSIDSDLQGLRREDESLRERIDTLFDQLSACQHELTRRADALSLTPTPSPAPSVPNPFASGTSSGGIGGSAVLAEYSEPVLSATSSTSSLISSASTGSLSKHSTDGSSRLGTSTPSLGPRGVAGLSLSRTGPSGSSSSVSSPSSPLLSARTTSKASVTPSTSRDDGRSAAMLPLSAELLLLQHVTTQVENVLDAKTALHDHAREIRALSNQFEKDVTALEQLASELQTRAETITNLLSQLSAKKAMVCDATQLLRQLNEFLASDQQLRLVSSSAIPDVVSKLSESMAHQGQGLVLASPRPNSPPAEEILDTVEDGDADTDLILVPHPVKGRTSMIVKVASLTRLLERLSHPSEIDTDFQKAFLLTYRFFVSAEELIERLVYRYLVTPPISRGDLETVTRTLQAPIRLRILNVLGFWAEHSPADWLSKSLSDVVLRFVENIVAKTGYQSGADQLRKRILKAQDTARAAQTRAHRDTGTTVNALLNSVFLEQAGASTSSMSSMYPILFSLMAFSPADVALVLTKMDFALFAHIQPEELMNVAWTRPEKAKLAPNLLAFIDFFNRTSRWAASEICGPADEKTRGQTIEFIMKVTNEAIALQNFNLAVALTSALQNSSIARLKRSWAAADPSCVSMLARHTKLLDNNYTQLRSAVRLATPPLVPFLGMLLTDLVFLEEMPDRVGDLIHFYKYHRISDIITEIQAFQKTPYTKAPTSSSPVEYLVKAIQAVGPQEAIHARSLVAEPRVQRASNQVVAGHITDDPRRPSSDTTSSSKTTRSTSARNVKDATSALRRDKDRSGSVLSAPASPSASAPLTRSSTIAAEPSPPTPPVAEVSWFAVLNNSETATQASMLASLPPLKEVKPKKTLSLKKASKK